MKRALSALALGSLAACAQGRAAGSTSPAPQAAPRAEVPFPSTYRPLPSRTTLIRGGTVMTAAGQIIPNGQVLMRDGRIAAVGATVDAPADAVVVDATGKFVTPGVIDTHSHLGAYASPGVEASSDGNEATSPNTAEVWVEHSVWPQDPGFVRALEGGVTTMQILPGSANLFGGRSVVLRNVPSRTVQGMKFPGAPYGLKMACGENPKRVYGQRGGPSTRMGEVAGFRSAWIRAADYRRRMDEWDRGGRSASSMPTRDLELETLAGVLRGEILVHNHCYRADEMAQMIDISHEFGFRIRSFHHGVEAYKIRDLMARDSIAGSLWADWWGFKMEALDFTRANLAMVHQAGARAIVHSDDPTGIQKLNQEAAKAVEAGREAGIEVSENDALRWFTANAAWALGIDGETGTLESGKRADVVIWSANPFSVYARADRVYIDGALLFDRFDPSRQPQTDFELGLFPAEAAR
ncbi:amidohydrolase [Longimicrobium terrae]|uniref:Imidazolonepropionase-like amidohydrolase n=1 Tax=Longimicrobium terrae TaxID=1639882 RepID=A0A841GYP5_9BACT|nr:amidohydrolase [Longimicrobium terrae]MBB4636647.1 imidazolonepropionase-like amidohydrolase [Longimicrobium terrae]MBB6070829.1 imidazolonepropionase-like amidohydrolase [Longimicrobium terrae]NNC28855.1 amidohydrolase [Longimicrobium terrae]